MVDRPGSASIPADPTRICAHCDNPIPEGRRADARFCSRRCQNRASSRRAWVEGRGYHQMHPEKARAASRKSSAKYHLAHLADLRLATIWRQILQRCLDPQHKSFEDYGAIGVCARWRQGWRDGTRSTGAATQGKAPGFLAFCQDMGPRPFPEAGIGHRDQHSVDRIDPEGNYSPVNCRWATRLVQDRNKLGNFIKAEQIPYIQRRRAEGMSCKAIGELLGFSYETIRRASKVTLTPSDLACLAHEIQPGSCPCEACTEDRARLGLVTDAQSFGLDDTIPAPAIPLAA